MIRIKRENRKYFDKLRHYQVILDNVSIGYISDGEIFEYTPQLGDHIIYLQIDWCRSNKIKFNISENEIFQFNCGGLNGKKMFLVYLYITFLKNKYLWIEKDIVRQKLSSV